MTARALTRRIVAGFIALAATGCGTDAGKADSGEQTLVVFNAGSLALPIRVAFDSFAVGRAITLQQESAGSLESARKLTELGKTPDVIALADIEIFPRLLVPKHAAWYVPFARNRMVIACRPSVKCAGRISEADWWQVLDKPGLNVGRADPNQDPNGYRTLLVLKLTERRLRQPGLATRLLNRWGQRYVRPKEADLVALLQAGELDYMWSYESMARAAGLPFITLGDSVDLGNPPDSLYYGLDTVRVRGARVSDSITFAGSPILYALSIPRGAPHPTLAAEFVRYLAQGDGARVLRSVHLDVLTDAEPIGDASGSPFRPSGRQ